MRPISAVFLTLAVCGCAARGGARDSSCSAPLSACDLTPTASKEAVTPAPQRDLPAVDQGAAQLQPNEAESSGESHQQEILRVAATGRQPPAENANQTPEELPSPPPTIEEPLSIEAVIDSVHRSFPLLLAALYQRDMAMGENLAAQGNFDLKLKGASENGPLGFYETYRHNIGFEVPGYQGGTLFGGYRVGRGVFQPWYLERQTNEGGELRTGVALPLARNVNIDARRAQLWRSEIGQQLAEPDIQAQQIDFVRAARYAYWDWVAAGRRYQVATALLKLAEDRAEAIRRRVDTGDIEPPVLEDNRRLIVSRKAKQIESQRKFQQSSVKLSLYYRDQFGVPIIVDATRLMDFPAFRLTDQAQLESDIAQALASRPDLQALKLQRDQLEIDLAEAENDLLPDVQVSLAGSQDVGEPTSSKRDKSEFELEAGVYLDVPVQRRKARGKMIAVQGKLNQLVAKTQMTVDKITADVRTVYAALVAAQQQIEQARESVRLAEKLADIERRKFELGESDLLSVNLREQQAAEAQLTELEALYDYFTAEADYKAVLARD